MPFPKFNGPPPRLPCIGLRDSQAGRWLHELERLGRIEVVLRERGGCNLWAACGVLRTLLYHTQPNLPNIALTERPPQISINTYTDTE